MTICVTGAGGFIGSHVVDTLLTAGHEVRAFVRYSSHGGWGWLEEHRHADTPERLEVMLADVTDARTVREAVEGCDAVLHLAALIGIPYSYRAPSSYVDVNVRGTMNVLEAARDADVQRVIVTSTSEVYGTARYIPIDEQHPLQAQSPYSATKIAADALAEAWARSFGLPVTVLRPFNTFGPRQSPRAIIPTIFGQLLAGRHELKLGRLDPRRDFTYVSDTARAFLLAMDAGGAEGRTVHLGTGSSVSIGELAELCAEVVGVDASIAHDARRDRPPASEVEVLESDPSLAKELLGWQPEVPLRQGLEQTLAAFRQSPPRDTGYAW